MTNPIVSAAYVALDHNREAIYGIGATPEEALAEARSYDDRPTNFDGEPMTDEEWDATFVIAAATQALVDKVRSDGGNCAFSRVGGVFCTEGEAEAE